MIRITELTHRLVRAAVVALVLAGAVACAAAPNQFVIVSDIHPSPDPNRGADAALAGLTEQLLKLHPAFVIQLGDFCGDPGLDPDLSRLDHAVQMFHRLREAGIEVYPVMGNHDIETENKIKFVCAHDPPFNRELDREHNRAVYDRWCRDHHYWYSFNRGGIHFAIIDSNVGPPGKNASPEDSAKWEAMRSWMASDLFEHSNNPGRFPTLVFMHHPEYVTGDRGCVERPLYRVLEEGREQGREDTVEAVFAGHWHHSETFAPEANRGIRIYATEVTVLPKAETGPGSSGYHPEYIVATVTPHKIVFDKVDTQNGGPGQAPNSYSPILGTFTSLDDRSQGTGRE
jgi:3',5'-cyclic AMP phosphodiesterase CpdA